MCVFFVSHVRPHAWGVGELCARVCLLCTAGHGAVVQTSVIEDYGAPLVPVDMPVDMPVA